MGHSDASNIKSLEFPFHTHTGEGSEVAREADGEHDVRIGEGKSQKNGGIRRNQRTNRHPGRGTREQGWRARVTNWN